MGLFESGVPQIPIGLSRFPLKMTILDDVWDIPSVDKPMWLVPAGALFGGSQYSHHQLAYYPCSYEVKR